jgi:hypothetical protein
MPTIEKTKVATTKSLKATVMMPATSGMPTEAGILATTRTLVQQSKNQEQQR